MTQPTASHQTLKNPEDEKKAELDKLDRSADEMADKASKTEQNYDRDHDIFRK
jgi:hypothetical protein